MFTNTKVTHAVSVVSFFFFFLCGLINRVPLPKCHMNCKDSLTICCWPECTLPISIVTMDWQTKRTYVNMLQQQGSLRKCVQSNEACQLQNLFGYITVPSPHTLS